MDAAQLFETVMQWLRENYADYRFFTERDIVWTVQSRLYAEIERQGLPFRVFNDYKMSPNVNVRADIAILEADAVAVAAEFKYEPDHGRSTDYCGGDIWHSKLQSLVVDWAEAEKDVERAKNYVIQRQAKTAYSVVIDEGGKHKWRPAPNGCDWQDWESGRWALWSKWP